MHVDEELSQKFLHGELDEPTDRSVRHHLAGCVECRTRVEQDMRAEAEVISLLERLDAPRPKLSPADVMGGETAKTATARRRYWPRAALIPLLLGAAATAAWAVPGSPARPVMESWLEQARTLLSAVSAPDPSDPADTGDVASAEAAGAAGDASGLAVDPGRELIVLFESTAPGATVSVSLFDGSRVEATAAGGTASFTANEGRLVIGNGGPGVRYGVRIPIDAPRVEIRAGGRSLFLKAGDGITTTGGIDETGAWLIPLGG